MHRGTLALALSALPLGLAALPLTPSLAREGVSREFFEVSVRPVLAAKCVSCHGPQQQLGGVRLDKALSKATAQKLIAAIRYDSQIKMPPTGKLPESDRTALTAWAKAGGTYPISPSLARAGGGGGGSAWP